MNEAQYTSPGYSRHIVSLTERKSNVGCIRRCRTWRNIRVIGGRFANTGSRINCRVMIARASQHFTIREREKWLGYRDYVTRIRMMVMHVRTLWLRRSQLRLSLLPSSRDSGGRERMAFNAETSISEAAWNNRERRAAINTRRYTRSRHPKEFHRIFLDSLSCLSW